MKIPVTEHKVEEQAEKSQLAYCDIMDAIARGVEARYELFTSHSRRTVEETIAIARKLDIPKVEIEKWATPRLVSGIAQVKVSGSLLKKV